MTLREFNEADYNAVFQFNSSPEIHKYTGDPCLSNPQQAKEIITNTWLPDYKKYGYGRWAAVYKPENKIIGFAGLKYLPELDETDIGFRFLPEYWGKGIASEVAAALIKYGFETLGLEKIIGIAMPENGGSCKVLEKVGLDLYKTDTYQEDGKNYHWYSIKKEKYAQQYS